MPYLVQLYLNDAQGRKLEAERKESESTNLTAKRLLLEKLGGENDRR